MPWDHLSVVSSSFQGPMTSIRQALILRMMCCHMALNLWWFINLSVTAAAYHQGTFHHQSGVAEKGDLEARRKGDWNRQEPLQTDRPLPAGSLRPRVAASGQCCPRELLVEIPNSCIHVFMCIPLTVPGIGSWQMRDTHFLRELSE